ncbi:MAG TPA: RNA polymerase sigma factor [Longimicrobiales bacterium]|nr:RNA polymerase sigma factor [Longimicrobiales bacterium]
MVNIALQVVEDSPADDAELIARAKAGDAHAVDQLVRKYLKDVHAVTSHLLGDYDLAQDAAQDAMVNAMNGLQRFRGDSSFRTWLLRVAVNAARSIGRRKTRRREVSIEVVHEAATDEPDAATMAIRHDDAQRATEMLKQLPEKQRMAVTLRTQQGLNYQEIGGLLDCSEGAARVNYHLGIKRLRELMK